VHRDPERASERRADRGEERAESHRLGILSRYCGIIGDER
jgi:hypothetical protein